MVKMSPGMILHLFSAGARGVSQVLDFVWLLVCLFIVVNFMEWSSYAIKQRTIEYHMPKILRESIFDNRFNFINAFLYFLVFHFFLSQFW